MFNHLESIHGWLALQIERAGCILSPFVECWFSPGDTAFYTAFSRRIFSTSYSWAGGASLFLTDISTPLFLHSCKNAHTVKTLAFGSTILSIPLCYYYLPNLCLRTQILMSASHVTFLMLTLSIPAAGFLELFISSHLHFLHNLSHVFSLSLSGLCYHPEQFYLKNQQLGLLTGLVLGGSFSFFCWAGSLNSLDHLHNFSLVSVSLLNSLPCPIYSPCSVTLSTPLLISSILLPYYPFDTTCLAFLSEFNYWPSLLSIIAEKAAGQSGVLMCSWSGASTGHNKDGKSRPCRRFSIAEGKGATKMVDIAIFRGI